MARPCGSRRRAASGRPLGSARFSQTMRASSVTPPAPALPLPAPRPQLQGRPRRRTRVAARAMLRAPLSSGMRLFGASAVPVCKAPWPAFHSMSGRQAAPMQRRVGPTAPRGRTRAVREAPGRAFKSLSCARQASRSTEVSATTCNDGGDIRKSKEKVKRGEEEERERVILPSLSSFFPRSPPTLLAAAAEATSTSSLAAPLAHAGDAGCNGSHHLPTTYLALSAPLASDRHLTRRQTRTSTYTLSVRGEEISVLFSREFAELVIRSQV